MGEFALYNGQRVKIGTCESMYYLRYEDRFKVTAEAHSLDPAFTPNLFWRLPFEDEDNVEIGCYSDFSRGYRLYQMDERGYCQDYYPEDELKPGSFQMSHPSGLLISVPCHHGKKLPDLGAQTRVGWNGKSHCFELVHIKNLEDGSVVPIIRCRHCGDMWRTDWADILPYIHGELLERLKIYAPVTTPEG